MARICGFARAGRFPQIQAVPGLIIATQNAHKVDEIAAILGAGFRCRSLRGIHGIPTVNEDAETFAGNARKKVVEMAAWLAGAASHHPEINKLLDGQPENWGVVADDSGLEVDVLHGEPGVRSARFAAGDTAGAANSPDAANNARLLRLMEGVPAARRTARFRCVVAFTRLPPAGAPLVQPEPDGADDDVVTHLFDGVCEGVLLEAPRGAGGFGYDPLFVPLGFKETFAELGEGIKNRISHRARALEKMKRFLQPA